MGFAKFLRFIGINTRLGARIATHKNIETILKTYGVKTEQGQIKESLDNLKTAKQKELQEKDLKQLQTTQEEEQRKLEELNRSAQHSEEEIKTGDSTIKSG